MITVNGVSISDELMSETIHAALVAREDEDDCALILRAADDGGWIVEIVGEIKTSREEEAEYTDDDGGMWYSETYFALHLSPPTDDTILDLTAALAEVALRLRGTVQPIIGVVSSA